jgi:hypothetical protein
MKKSVIFFSNSTKRELIRQMEKRPCAINVLDSTFIGKNLFGQLEREIGVM